MTMRDVLGGINFNLQQLTALSEEEKRVISELIKHIDYFNFSRYISEEIISRISEFRTAFINLFWDPISLLEEDIGNTESLKPDELSFIERAYYLNDLSRKLHNQLAESITCSRAHTAQLHLSGFLFSDASFEVYINTICGEMNRVSAAHTWLGNLFATGHLLCLTAQ